MNQNTEQRTLDTIKKPRGRQRKYELPEESKAVHILKTRVGVLTKKIEQAKVTQRLEIAAMMLPKIYSGSINDDCRVALEYADALILIASDLEECTPLTNEEIEAFKR